MKKIVTVLMGCTLLLVSLTGCQSKENQTTPAATTAKTETTTAATTEVTTEVETTTLEVTTTEKETATESTVKEVLQPDGSTLVIDEIPQKVLVLSSTTLELLDAVGVKITATSSLSSKPALAEKFKDAVDVGMATKPDMEIIATVSPDLIIAGSMFMNMKDQFEAQGYKTWFVNNQTYEDTLTLIENFGYVFDKEDEAAALILDFETRKEAALETNKTESPKTIMIIFGAGDQVMLGSDQCYSGSLAKLFGHKNVADDMDLTGATSGYIPFSLETALAAEPDVIFRVAHGNPEETKKMFDEMFEQNPAYQTMKAVTEGKVYDLSYDLFFSNPGLKCIEAIEELGELLNK